MEKQKIRLSIDDIPVEVEKGKTILEAAEAAGIRVPSLCNDQRLIPFGACRLCMVQEKGKEELLPSCFTPAKNGMEITTHSPEIIESRRKQLQLILLNHPMICPRCEKEGECDLQDLVYEYGVQEILYPWNLITFPPDDLSLLLQRDGNKCILCGRCVRICDEVQGVGELSFTGRGYRSIIDTDFHRPIRCEFCGQCLDTCPVGAIASNCFDYKTKAWELTETTTPCPYCGCGCLLVIGSREGEIKRVSSDPLRGRHNDGNLCVKGRFGWDFADHPERLQSPMMRVNGKLEEVSWEEAFGFVIQRFEEIKGQYGPRSIGAVLSSRLANEEYFLLKKLLGEAIGSGQIALDGSRTDQGLGSGLLKTLGGACSTNAIQEIRNADSILIIGVDPAQTHPIIKNEIHLAIRKNKAQLIVLGNYEIGLSRNTQMSPLSPPSISLLTTPGGELSLLNGMIGVILRDGLEEKGFLGGKTEGFEALRQRQGEYLERLALFPDGVTAAVEKAGKNFAQAKNAMVLIGPGHWSDSGAEEIAIASSNLALLTGHVGRRSSGILLLLEKCNSQGAIDMGISFSAEKPGDLLRKAEEGSLKALYLIGKNPHLSSPALKNLELLVVQDLFMTEAGKEAHVLLPACSFIEKSGTFTNLERRLQRLHPLRPPKGQSKPDFDILLEVLRRMEVPLPGETPEAVFQKMTETVPQYRDLQDGEQWPKGIGPLYGDGFPAGKAKLIPLATPPPPTEPGQYPFRLIGKRSLFRSGELSLRSGNLKKVMEKPFLEMNAGDAQSLKIENGEVVQISNEEGRSLKMRVEISATLAPSIIAASSPCSLIKEGTCRAKVERLKKT